MRNFSIKCLLGDNDIQLLKNLRNETINVNTHLFCNCITSMIELNSKIEKYYIYNTATLQEDKDEYPVMKICKKNELKYIEDFDNSVNFSLFNTKIKHVIILRDTVNFTHKQEKFNIISDIGLKFITDTIDMLLIMEDSIGDLIDIYLGDNLGLHDSEEELKKQWEFKADKFESLKREEIKIF